MAYVKDSKSAAVRKQLDHPVIDGDGHWLEPMPIFLDYLKQVGDPATGLPIGNTEKNLKASVAGETYEYETMYPGMAKTARDEGFDDVGEWFETLAKAEKSHAGRFTKMLAVLKG